MQKRKGTAGAIRSRSLITPTERVARAVDAAGGSAPRAEIARLVAPALGVKGTREALATAVAFGVVDLDEYDVLTLPEARR